MWSDCRCFFLNTKVNEKNHNTIALKYHDLDYIIVNYSENNYLATKYKQIGAER